MTWSMRPPAYPAIALLMALTGQLEVWHLAVAGFGILATFYMIVVEKTRDVGILKALGGKLSDEDMTPMQALFAHHKPTE